MTIEENVCLADYTTFKIGGFARYFLIVENIDNLIEAIDFIRQKNLPYFVLGGGSNLLVSDEGYKGTVIRINSKHLTINNNTIVVGAGVLLNDLVNFAAENNLTGLEWAAGIPGTVGGAIRGNAGAFGKCMADNIYSVNCSSHLRIKIYNNNDCEFSYRDSAFKHNKDIIISAEIKLQKDDKKESRKLISQNLKTRKQKHPLEYPSAGCVFQNPKPLAAADLIEQCGLKGKQIGQAMISKKHANFIINLNRAKAQDVLKLIELIKKEVKNKFKIDLKEEIEYLGF